MTCLNTTITAPKTNTCKCSHRELLFKKVKIWTSSAGRGFRFNPKTMQLEFPIQACCKNPSKRSLPYFGLYVNMACGSNVWSDEPSKKKSHLIMLWASHGSPPSSNQLTVALVYVCVARKIVILVRSMCLYFSHWWANLIAAIPRTQIKGWHLLKKNTQRGKDVLEEMNMSPMLGCFH